MADDTDDALKKHRDLLIACGWGKEVDVILLLQQGASVRVQDQEGKNCLHYAACKGHIQVTNLLIDNGCAINAKDKCNRTPLHLAAEEGHNDIVSILLDHNGEFDVQDEEGFTPSHVTCLNDHTEVLELLIHIKADLTIKSKEGLTPLHLATIHGNVKSMALLIQAGVCLSPQDTQGNTPLHLAIQANSFKALKCLVKNGANVNVQNHDGDTPLHICADMGMLQFAEYILNSNQPVELSPNNVGDTAKDIAIRHGYREIVQLIPDPFRKRKSKRRNRSSDSPADQDSQHCSNISTSEPTKMVVSPTCENLYHNSVIASRTGVFQHPSEELPTATSSSVSSLWVPTTDSGISLPMDTKIEPLPVGSAILRRKQKKVDKPKVVEDLKLKHPKKEKILLHEYDELRQDPRFMSAKGTPKHTPKLMARVPKPAPHLSLGNYDDQEYSRAFKSGAASDESMQYRGCFFRTKSKKLNYSSSVKGYRKHSADHEKELLMQRQAELRYELSISKVSLEKQMRKMRKKFEKALLATDNRFLEQKRREEGFHNQLRTELEIIEKSLERGSKRNVEEFAHQIKSELNNLTEKLTQGLDLNVCGSTEDESARTSNKKNNRSSAVDLSKDISVSLCNMNNSKHLKYGKSKLKDGVNSTKRGPNNEESIQHFYEKRLRDLENEIKQNAKKERENEELRARVRELELIIKGEKTSSVT